MKTQANIDFIERAVSEATASGHIWPEMAAAEAALESAHLGPEGTTFGGSELAQKYNNLFGTKQHVIPVYTTVVIPTQEYSRSRGWYTIDADWIVYPDWASSFKDRMATLVRLAPQYPHYAAALAATDPITYVTQVSLTWSTGPTRGATVIQIYNEYCK